MRSYNKYLGYSYIISAISSFFFPFFTLIYSFKNHNKKWSKNIFWLSSCFLGLIFLYNASEQADYSRYAMFFENIRNTIPSYKFIFENSFSVEYSQLFKDPFMPILMYSLSFISTNPQIYFFVFAIIYGFFFSRNLWFLFDKLPAKYNHVVSVLIIFYVLILPIYGYARIWLAIHIFLFGAFPYIFNKDKSKIIWIGISFFVHYTIMFMIIAVLLYRFIPKRTNILLLIFLGTFLITEIDLPKINTFLSNLFPFISSGLDSYANEEYADSYFDKEFSIGIFITTITKKITIISLTIINWFIIKKSKMQIQEVVNLFNFALYIYSISNIIALIPSAGRYIYLSQFFLIAAFILTICYYPTNYKIKKYQYISYLFLFSIFASLKYFSSFFGFILFYGNYINFYLIENIKPIISYF